MFIAIETPQEIAACQKKFVDFLKSEFKHIGKRKVGFQGNSFECDLWAGSNIWFATKTISDKQDPDSPNKKRIPRYWNAFGLSDGIETATSLNIIVEINVPKKGANRRVGGLFARNPISGNISLLHRGLIGGGKKNIGKEAYLRWNSDDKKKVNFKQNKEEDLVLVGRLGSKTFIADLEKFIIDVAEFKAAIRLGIVNEASFLSPEELEKRAKENSGNRAAKVISTKVFQRDPFVSEWAKVRAAGKCQLCGKKAPFLDQLRKPYLETHHLNWLSKGGSDSVKNTIALCPNCHRKMHVCNDPQDRLRLVEMAKKS